MRPSRVAASFEHDPGPSRAPVLQVGGEELARPRRPPRPRRPSTPRSRSAATPRPDTWGSGSSTPTTTRATPAAAMAPVHGGVRPWWAHGSSVVYSVAPRAPVAGRRQGDHLGVRAPRRRRGPLEGVAVGRDHHGSRPRDWGTCAVRTEAASARARRMAARSSSRVPDPGRLLGGRHGTTSLLGFVALASGQGFLSGERGSGAPPPRDARRRRSAEPATRTRAPARTTAAAVSSSMPPSTSSSAREPAPVELGAGAGDLGQDLGHERLTAEAGVDGHAQDQVGLGPGRGRWPRRGSPG